MAYEVCKRFYNCGIEREELKAIALLGLTKAAVNFDEMRGGQFATFASVVIRNELLMELRKRKKSPYITSLDEEVQGFECEPMENITLLDMLPWEEKGYEIIENRDFMPVILMSMTKRERECIALTILEERTQEEASRILGLSQSYVSKSIKSGLSKARKAYWSN